MYWCAGMEGGWHLVSQWVMCGVWSARRDGGRCWPHHNGDGYEDTRGWQHFIITPSRHNSNNTDDWLRSQHQYCGIMMTLWHTRMAQTQPHTAKLWQKVSCIVFIGKHWGQCQVTNLSTLILTRVWVSERYPLCPSEVLHRHLLLPPHGAVIAGSRSGRDRVGQQAYTELAPQPAKNKYHGHI